MFLALGIAYALVVTICCWLLHALWTAWRFMARSGSVTIQVMTVEERRAEEEFVEHARRRAWKELYLEVGQ
jgi:hypothetical protein